MRGEHAASFDMTGDITGSSPHARGALDIAKEILANTGIIPACAGSTKH